MRGKIFLTVPPGDVYLHVFVGEEVREPALSAYPEFLEKLTWGQKVVGLRVNLAAASSDVVKGLVRQAWTAKAPASLRGAQPK